MKIIAVKVFQLKQLKRRNLKKFRLEREVVKYSQLFGSFSLALLHHFLLNLVLCTLQ